MNELLAGVVIGAVGVFALQRLKRAIADAPEGIERHDCMRFIPRGAAVEAYWLGYEDGQQDANELLPARMFEHAESRGPIHHFH